MRALTCTIEIPPMVARLGVLLSTGFAIGPLFRPFLAFLQASSSRARAYFRLWIHLSWSRQNMIFERTMIFSLYDPYSIYFSTSGWLYTFSSGYGKFSVSNLELPPNRNPAGPIFQCFEPFSLLANSLNLTGLSCHAHHLWPSCFTHSHRVV